LFLRFWSEISTSNFKLDATSREDAKKSGIKWFPCNKGGGDRKWYGHNEYVINWLNDGEALFNHPNSAMRNVDYYFKEGLTWSGLSASGFSARYFPVGHVFNSAGRSMLPSKNDVHIFLGLLNSKVGDYFFGIVAPTLSFTVGNVASMPYIDVDKQVKDEVNSLVKQAVNQTNIDWDSFETSWNFTRHPLLTDNAKSKIVTAYNKLRQIWNEAALQLKNVEEKNNRIFIDTYGLQDVITPEVDIE